MGFKELFTRGSQEPKPNAELNQAGLTSGQEAKLAKYYQAMNEESREVLDNPWSPQSFFKSKVQRGKRNNVVNDGANVLRRGKEQKAKKRPGS